MIGSTLGHFRILEELGRGGMGVVYLAEDTKLKRRVALKLLPQELARDETRLARLKREAEALAALTHPNIVTIYSIEEVDGETFITMEYVEGQTLRDRIPTDGLALDEFFKVAVPLAEAVGAAHERDIIHRDLKPANVLVASDGRIKVLDFGLARLSFASSDESPTQSWVTGPDVVVGTAPYMSPEQIKGLSLDARSDVFALGAVFYEMLSGERPFAGNSRAEIAAAILERQPPSVGGLSRGVPGPLAEIVERCLEKQPGARFASAREVASALRVATHQPTRRPAALTGAIVVGALALAALGGWQWRKASLERGARARVPEIEALISQRRFPEAFKLAGEAIAVLPDDPRLEALAAGISVPFDVTTTPAGARVSYKPYMDVDGPWTELGVSPIEDDRVPHSSLRWRIEATGYRTWEGEAAAYFNSLHVDLAPEVGSPEGMVRIPSGSVDLAGQTVEVPGFWLDQHEVTNREYAAFVAAGGYADRSYWPSAEPEERPFERLVEPLTDLAGRPGPAAWRLGSFPEGRADHPVTGVSWFEAAAYCAFAEKTLPTLFHWRHGAGPVSADDMLVISNFSGKGTAPVASFAGIGTYGAFDMAGNAKEWTWNAIGLERHLAGGAWNEPEYLFHAEDHLSPFERSEAVGFRCARLDSAPEDSLLQPVEITYYDFAGEVPVSGAVYEAFLSSYSYDRVPLDARTERTVEEDPRWRVETVSFEMGPGEPRMLAHVYLPRSGSPPFQTVVYFPGSSALGLTSSDNLAEASFFEFLPASGRVFVHPVYEGTYERGGTVPTSGVAGRRDRITTWANEVSRVVDYLEERDDVDSDRLALFGLSLGAIYGPIFAAVEPRFEATVLLGGGLSLWNIRNPAEINPINFASRVQTPTLVIAGRNDVLRPPETAQRPIFDLIDVPDEDKRFVILEGGHIPDWNDIIRETLDWLDRYLGPVGTPTG